MASYGVSKRGLRSGVVLAAVSILLLLSAPARSEEVFTARHLGDYGNVTVMEVTGNYDAKLPDGSSNALPRQQIAKEFYKTHQDDYDFLIIFSNFDFRMPEGEVIAFYHGVRNDIEGIGQDIFNSSRFYGSEGRLQGTVDMGNLAAIASDPLDPRIEFTLGTLNHEILHRWGAHLKFRDAAGNISNALIGRDGSHWSSLLDTQGSLHYGSRWRNNGDGTFTAIEARTYFSPLDLYVMGMIGPEQVPPMLLIENPDIDPTQLPKVGTTIRGTARTVTIEEIIAAEGPRIPAAAEAQKSFKTAFLYITSPGTFKSEDLAALERIRNGFLTRYSILTDGQGLVQVAVAPKEALPANPGVTDPTTAPRTLPPSLEEGIGWLVGRQKPDGTWADASATTLRDTSEALNALNLFGVAGPTFDAGLSWLGDTLPFNNDYLARKIETRRRAGADTSALIVEMVARQNPDGGWGTAKNFVSNPTDTALALKALGRAGYGAGPVVSRAISFLLTRQNTDGGWSGEGPGSLIQPTANTLLALNRYRTLQPLDEAIGRGADFLKSKQNRDVDGGFGNSPSTVYDSAAALLALSDLGIAGDFTRQGVDYLLARQTADGSWYDSPYQTAMAVQAVYQGTVEPDLAIAAADVTFIPEKIVKLPTHAVVNAEIRNLGRTAVPQAKVALYAGEVLPENLVEVQSAAFPGESSTVVTFPVPILDGQEHLFIVVVDPDGLIEEQSETNNRAAKILSPEPTCDLEIAADLGATPNPVDIFSDVTVTATIRNYGTVDASRVPVRFSLEEGESRFEIGTRTVDIPANGTVSIDLVWRANRAGESFALVAEADPFGTFLEFDESNNRASIPIAVRSSTLPNLAISYNNLVVEPAPALQGGMAGISIPVGNEGFTTAENVAVEFFRGVPEDGGVLISSQTLGSLPPGQAMRVACEWNPIDESGIQVIYVVVDREERVSEIAEDDNRAFVTVQVLSLPDPSVSPSSITINPLMPVEGDQATIAVTVQNRGEQAAENIQVRIFDNQEAIGSREIPSIGGLSSATVTFEYDTAGKAGPHVVTAMVDPSPIEKSEDNNKAEKSFAVQNANLWLSQQYISPNGDGVQDSTEFFFRLDVPQSVQVAVLDKNGAVVRTFAGGALDEAASGAVTWDGRNGQGTIVQDGGYLIQVMTAGGITLSGLPIVVDTNRASAEEASGSPLLKLDDVFGRNKWKFVSWLPDESGLIFEGYASPQGWTPQTPYGLYRVSLDGGSVQLLTPPDWSPGPPHADLPFQTGWSPSGDALAVVYTPATTSPTFTPAPSQLWVVDAGFKEWLLLDASSYAGGWVDQYNPTIGLPRWSPDGSRVAYRGPAEGADLSSALWTINRDGTGKVRHDSEQRMNWGDYASWESFKWSPDGNLIAYTSDDAGPYQLLISDMSGNARVVYEKFRDYHWEWISDHELIVGDEIYSRESNAYIINVDNTSMRLIGEDVYALHVSPDGRYILLFLDDSRVIKYDVVNGGVFHLGDYEDFDPEVVDWYRDLSNFEKKYFSRDGSKFFLTSDYGSGTSLLVIDSHENTSKKFDLGREYEGAYPAYPNPPMPLGLWAADNESIILPIRKPLDTGYELIKINVVNESAEKLDYTIGEFTRFGYSPHEGYAYFDDYDVWSEYGWSSLYTMWRGLTSEMPHDFSLFKFLVNLTADLRVTKLRTEVLLEGIATDLNFAGYRLEYADVQSPEEWFPVRPPSEIQAVNQILASWIPPYQGKFLIRLTVWDRAGNVAWDRKQVTWGESTSISNLYKSLDIFSPNGDGVKDAVELHYRVLDPAHLTFAIYDSDDSLVKTIYADHPAPGTAWISWDGLDEENNQVPDGIYSIRVLDYAFSIEVDNTPPAVAVEVDPTIQLDQKDRSTLFTSLSGHVLDARLKSWQIDSGEGNNPQVWQLLLKGDRKIGKEVLKDGLITFEDASIATYKGQNLGLLGGRKFRIVAEDLAGNTSSFISEQFLEKKIFILKWDEYVVFQDGDDSRKLPMYLLRPGLHEIAGVQTFGSVLAQVGLQYRVGLTWFDASSAIETTAGGITIRWDNSSVQGEINSLRIRGVDRNGEEHFSDVLSTENAFKWIDSQCQLTGRNYLPDELKMISFQVNLSENQVWQEYAVYASSVGNPIPVGDFPAPRPILDGTIRVRMVAVGKSGRSYYSNPETWSSRCSSLVTIKIVTKYPEADCGEISGRVIITPDIKVENGISIALQEVKYYLEKSDGLQLLGSTEKGKAFTIDLQGWPEGTYKVRAVLGYQDLKTLRFEEASANTMLIVDRALPTVQLTYPSGASQTICPFKIPDTESYGIAVEGRAVDEMGISGWKLFYNEAENPESWREVMRGNGPAEGSFGTWDMTGLDGREYSLKLKAVDTAGNVSCHTATFSVDTLIAIADLSLDKTLFSPNGDGAFDDLQIAYRIEEPAQVAAEIFPLARSSNGTPSLGSAPVRTLGSGISHLGGEGSLSWDGANNGGGTVPDGEYGVVIKATDSCGNTNMRWTSVTVDNTPPVTGISYPTAAAQLGTIVEVKGQAVDPHFKDFTVDVGEGLSPTSWTTVAAANRQIEDGVLGSWNAFGLEGVWTLRLRAWDAVENSREFSTTVKLEPRPDLIKRLQAQPAIFSPNRDGKLDFTTIEYELTAGGKLTLDLLDSSGTVMRSEAQEIPSAGVFTYSWTGINAGGEKVADGKYQVRLTASPLESPALEQVETVTVVVDTTPPEMTLLQPEEGAHLKDVAIVFKGTVSDPNLREYAIKGTGPGGVFSVGAGTGSKIDQVFGQATDLAEGEYDLTAEASDLAGNSTQLSITFTIDRTPPSVTLTSPVSGSDYGATKTPIDIAGAVVETNLESFVLRYASSQAPDQWQILTEGKEAPTAPQLLSLNVGKEGSLADGVYILSLYARDQAGQEGEARVTVTVDNTPPAVSLSSLADGDYVKGPIELIGTLSDSNLKEGSLELSEGSCEGAYQWVPMKSFKASVAEAPLIRWEPLPSNGDYCLKLAAVDRVGNGNEVRIGVKVLAHPPAPPVLSGRIENRTDVSLEWTSGDAPGLAGIDLYRNGVKLNDNPLAQNGYVDAGLEGGSYAYAVRAVDLAGNESELSNALTLVVDLTPPTVQITTPAAGAQVGNFVDLNGTAHSDDDFKEYRIYFGQGENPGNWNLLETSPLPKPFGTLFRWDLVGLADGVYLVKLEAEDTAGNLAAHVISLAVDNSAPQAPVLTSATVTSSRVNLAWQAGSDLDIAGYLLYRNDKLVNGGDCGLGRYQSCLFTGKSYADNGVPDGEYSYYLVAVDLAGNLSDQSNTRQVTVETGPPVVTIVAPSYGTAFEQNVLLRAESVARDIASLRFEYSTSSTGPWHSLVTILPPSSYEHVADPRALGWTYGNYYFRAVALDKGGKTGTSYARMATFTDLTPPDPPENFAAVVKGGDVHLTWTPNNETDLDGYLIYRRQAGELTWDLIGTTEEAEYLDGNLADGDFIYALNATDNYQNVSGTSAEVTARIYAPQLFPVATPTLEAEVTIAGAGAGEGMNVEIYRETETGVETVGMIMADGEGRFSLPNVALQAGDNTFTAKAFDPQGNESRISAPLTVTRGDRPGKVTGLQGVVEGRTVHLSWDSIQEDNLAGYHIYRNGEKLGQPPSAATPISITASSTWPGYPVSNVADGLSYTDWWSDYYWEERSEWVDLTFPKMVYLETLTIDWIQPAENFEVQIEKGGVWVTVASVTGNSEMSNTIHFDPVLVAEKIRLLMTPVMGDVGISELAMTQSLPYFADNAHSDSGLPDGKYRYRVAAVSKYGFEGEAAETGDLIVGDGTPPARPTGLQAVAENHGALLSWNANQESDLAGYFIYQDGVRVDLPPTPVAPTAISASTTAYPSAPITNAVDRDPYTYWYSQYGSEESVVISLPEPTFLNEISISWVSSSNAAKAFEIQTQRGDLWVTLAAITGNTESLNRLEFTPTVITGKIRILMTELNGRVGIAEIGILQQAPYGNISFRDPGLSPGSYTYNISAVDTAGNESELSLPALTTIEMAAPKLVYPVHPGSRITVFSNVIDVTGTAEPGSRVELFNNGVSAGHATARNDSATREESLDFCVWRAQISPDGRKISYLACDDRALWIHDIDSGTSTMIAEKSWNFSWAPMSDRLAFEYRDGNGNGRIGIYDVMNGTMAPLTDDPIASEWEPSWTPDGRQVVFECDRAGDGYYDVWARDILSGELTRLTVGHYAYLPVVSPDGEKLAFFGYGDRYASLYLMNLSDGSIRMIFEDAYDWHFDWSPDSKRLVFTGNQGSVSNIFTYDLRDEQVRQISDAYLAEAPKWSPDGETILFHGEGLEGEGLWLAIPEKGQLSLWEPLAYPAFFDWNTLGEMVVIDGESLKFSELPGYFKVNTVELSPGENVLYATATDNAGNQSTASEAISVVYENSRLADISVSKESLSFYPLYPKVGEKVSARVEFQNNSDFPADNIDIDVYLWDAAGTLTLVRAEKIQHLSGREESSFSFSFNAEANGVNSLIVVVDPADRIDELIESNNSVAKEFLVGGQGKIELIARLNESQFGANQEVGIEISLGNSGPAREVVLSVAVEDEAGIVVDAIAVEQKSLPYGPLQILSLRWNTGNVFAGNYQVHVTLTGDSGVLAEERIPLKILPDVRLDTGVRTEKLTYGANEKVTVRFALKNAGSNWPLPPHAANITIFDAAGATLRTIRKEFPALWPGMQEILNEEWNTGISAPGEYRVQAEVSADGKLIATDAASLTVVPDAVLSGELRLDSAVVLIGGQITAKYSVLNRGNTGASGILRATIVDPRTMVVLGTEEKSLSLGQELPAEGEFTFASADLELQAYRIALKFVTDNQEKTLSWASFEIKDGTPPQITIHSPEADLIYNISLPLKVTAVDDATGVEKVEYQIDARGWMMLSPANAAEGRYSFLWEPALADNGKHTIRFRGYDRTGNVTETDPVPFEIQMDNVPPVTEIIAGTPQFVSAGGTLYVTGATGFTLVATDNFSGVASTAYRIGNGVWVAYQPFTLAGLTDEVYSISYFSVDGATNKETEQSLTATVDNTAPATTLTVGEPQVSADGVQYVTGSTLFTLSAVDSFSGVASTEYRLDEGSWQTYAEPFTLAGLLDGKHVIAYRSTDNLAHREAEQILTVQVDNAAPVTTATIGEPHSNATGLRYVAGTTLLTLSASDDLSGVARTEYRLNGGEWQTYVPFTLRDEEEYLIEYRSIDRLGIKEEIHPLPVITDVTPPESGIGFSTRSFLDGEAVLISADTEVTLTAADRLSGVKVIQYRFDEEPDWRTYYGTFRLADLASGTHVLRYRSLDNVENAEAEKEVLLARIGIEFGSEILNLPRVLVWRGDCTGADGDEDAKGHFEHDGGHEKHDEDGRDEKQLKSHDEDSDEDRFESYDHKGWFADHDHEREGQDDNGSCREGDGDGEEKAESARCGSTEDLRQFLTAALGVSDVYYTLVQNKKAFRTALRSGVYNVLVLLGPHTNSDTVFLREMKEAVWRGTGLLIAGENSVHPVLQDIFGLDFRGSLPMDEEERTIQLFESPLAAAQSQPIRGRVLRTRLDGGTLAGIVPGESTCSGIRSLALGHAVEVRAGDRLTASLAVPQGKKLNIIDDELVTIGDFPVGPVNRSSGQTGGDLAIIGITADGIGLSLAAPYGYLGDSYLLSLTLERPDGTRTGVGPVAISPTCAAGLRAGVAVGPFSVLQVGEDRVRSGDDLPAAVMNLYGRGKTVFLAYDLLGSAAVSPTGHQDLLRQAAGWLLPEGAEPRAADILLVETRIRPQGAGLDLLAREVLGEGLTARALFGLPGEPLEFPFTLAAGEEGSYRYFLQLPDQAGEFGKQTDVHLGLGGEYVLFDSYPVVFRIDNDSRNLLLAAVSWIDAKVKTNPEAAAALQEIRSQLEEIASLPGTSARELGRLIDRVVQILHQVEQLPLEASEVREIVGEYLRILEGKYAAAEVR